MQGLAHVHGGKYCYVNPSYAKCVCVRACVHVYVCRMHMFAHANPRQRELQQFVHTAKVVEV